MAKDKARAYEVWANLVLPIMVVLSSTVGWFIGQYVNSGGTPVAYVGIMIFALVAGAASTLIRTALRDRARTIRFTQQYEKMLVRRAAYWGEDD